MIMGVTRRDLFRICAAPLAIAAVLGAAGASAQEKSVAEIALYEGADRQQMLEDGARQEGTLTLYTIGANIEPMIERFQEKYPFLKVELVRSPADETTRRVMEEYAAGTYLVDVLEQSVSGLIVPRDQGVLQPYHSPEAAMFDPIAVDPDGYWVTHREGYTGIAYNTEKISPEEAPKTYADLLDPKWRGRMAIATSSTSTNWVGALVITQGEDYVRKLGEQDIRVYEASSNALANLIVSGEVDMSPTIYLSQVEARRAEGAPLAWVAPGPVPVLDASAALAANAPHPHAAMLYIDYLLSKEGQLYYREIGYLSSRTDMPATDAPALEKVFLGNRPNYFEEFEQWSQLFQEVFIRGEILKAE
jgi:iron(III) transport system substrate-binding protein